MSIGRRLLILVALLVFPVLLLQAADGDLDPTFGTGGKVTTDVNGNGGHDRGSAIAIQSDGKLVVAGYGDNENWEPVVVLARYDTLGVLDPTFGPDANGKVLLNFFAQWTPAEREGLDVLIQPDHKIVVAATVASGGPYTSPTDFGIARFLDDGTPDPSFGSGGYVTTDFGSPGDLYPTSDGAASVALQADGKIVVAGFARVNGGSSDFALARYDTFGNLDPSFDSDGKVLLDFFGLEDWANGVAIQADGSIVAVGLAQEQVSQFDYRRYAAVARFSGVNGAPDATFAGTGKTTIDFSPSNPWEHWNEANAVAIQADGRIVVAGTSFINNLSQATNFDFAVARYTTLGVLDSTFDGDGLLTTDFIGGGDVARDVVIQQDGKIVVVGSRTEGNSGTDLEITHDFALARYDDTSGALDTTFGSAATGKVTTAFDGVDVAQGVAIDDQCRIVAVGFSWVVDYSIPQFQYDSNFALARYQGSVCSQPPPVYRCPLSIGYWKNTATWPVATLTLGSQLYTETQLRAILQSNPRKDASLILAQQLIAAKLNIANGSDPAPISTTITHADTLLSAYSGKLPYSVPPSSATGQQMTTDAKTLESYNLGQLTPQCVP